MLLRVHFLSLRFLFMGASNSTKNVLLSPFSKKKKIHLGYLPTFYSVDINTEIIFIKIQLYFTIYLSLTSQNETISFQIAW